MRVITEKWKTIPDTQKRYEVSNFGRVRSVERMIIYSTGRKHYHYSKYIKLRFDAYGYLMFNIRNKGKQQCFKVHRLVALLFIPNKYGKKEVNHKDGDKTNNRVDNLEWVTSSENKKHAIRLGLSDPVKNLRPVKGADNCHSKTLIFYKDGKEVARYRPMYKAKEDGIKLYKLLKLRKKQEKYDGMDYKIV